jgi:hypothetical protein
MAWTAWPWPLLLAVYALLTSGCAGISKTDVNQDVAPITASGELPEDELLNVAIEVFDPGELPEDREDRAGLSEEIRQAEANFLPVQLKYTLQHSGYWGSVWVVPRPERDAASTSQEPEDGLGQDEDADLVISGRIEYSDGERLELAIKAVDARNVVWLDKIYSETSLPSERSGAQPERQDSFQDLFNAISNDLIEFRNGLSPQELATIRRLSELRYAASMSKEPFSRYISRDEDGHYVLVGLPAENDPMLARIRAIKARDEMLKDTISSYYDNFYSELWSPYQHWRKFRSEELAVMREIKAEALKRQVLGFAAIAGAIALGAVTGEDAQRILDPLRDIMAVGGAMAVYSGYQKRQEAKMNEEVIEELGQSFSSDARPLVVEVHGQTMRLTGSARQQYEQWRQLLKRIYLEETGIGEDLPLILGPEAAEPANTADSDRDGLYAPRQFPSGTNDEVISSGVTNAIKKQMESAPEAFPGTEEEGDKAGKSSKEPD